MLLHRLSRCGRGVQRALLLVRSAAAACRALPPHAPHPVRFKHERNVKIKVPGGGPLLFREEDVEEQYVRGGGTGGQSVAKTSNCVILKHVPTNTVVRCHKTRSRDLNRRLARTELQLRLDELAHGALSVRSLKGAKDRKKARKKALKVRQRSKTKYGGGGGKAAPVTVQLAPSRAPATARAAPRAFQWLLLPPPPPPQRVLPPTRPRGVRAAAPSTVSAAAGPARRAPRTGSPALR